MPKVIQQLQVTSSGLLNTSSEASGFVTSDSDRERRGRSTARRQLSGQKYVTKTTVIPCFFAARKSCIQQIKIPFFLVYEGVMAAHLFLVEMFEMLLCKI